VLVAQREQNGGAMRKAKSKVVTGDPDVDGMPDEYDFSKLGPMVRGKYYDRVMRKKGYARLEPEVQQAFPTDEAVNRALRSLMESGANGGI